MRQYLTATIQALSQPEINDIVDPYWLEQVKKTDPHPEIRVYSIGHEGQSNLHLPGIGNKTFTWIQAAVQWIGDKLRLRTPVFDRHDPNSNSHAGRTQIGEVVGKTLKQIGDKMNVLAAVYVQPAYKTRPLDVASIEAEIEYDHDGFQAWPTAVNHVSGVALSNSGIDTPGFPGATLLGAVQAYVQAFAGEIGATTMNLSDVKQAAKDNGWSPTQIFGVDDIMADTKVVAKVKEDHQHTLNANERLTRERDEVKTKLTQAENEKAEAEKKWKQSQVISKSASVLDTLLADPNRKLDDKAKAFVKRNMKNFTAEADDEAALKTELGKFVDTTVNEYQELAKDVFGVSVEAPAAPEAGQNPFTIPNDVLVGQQNQETKPPAPSNEPITRDEVLSAEMNPEYNPLIPGSKLS